MALHSNADLCLLNGPLPVILIDLTVPRPHLKFPNCWLFPGWGRQPHAQPPSLEDQVSIFISPEDWVDQLYPQALSTHFSRLLRHAWVTVGLFFFPRSPHGDCQELICPKWHLSIPAVRQGKQEGNTCTRESLPKCNVLKLISSWETRHLVFSRRLKFKLRSSALWRNVMFH
jgi:hypothetical protein